MKNKLIILLIAIAVFSIPTLAQVTISAKKVTYKRPKPIMDFKKSFTITYPKIKAATPALSKKIEAVLSYEKAFDFKLREEMNEIQWLEEANYDVNYNANKMLSISLTIQGTGAYPSGSTKYLVVNTSTGTRIRPIDVFINTSGLLTKLAKIKDDEVKKTIMELKNAPETKDEDLSGIFNDSETYSKVKLDEFEIDENGVIFHHDYGFPHVALALQPTGEFFLTWKELKPYIKPDGLLGQFVR
ncbi:MAG: hypothetical protein IPL32_16250 [Chloracidobacterium sp.]|nr:hypothetical protein [Chloracidobacterium sp.]